ncbi:hypothetical protein [Citrobacter braakii]|uniref:hypothetical protein n=1 Tax=Citrobacter braakii TaxID=57706 RepID=UPI002B2D0840|nr:hypothetical protein R0Q77_11355 [Citrobacter braakii]
MKPTYEELVSQLERSRRLYDEALKSEIAWEMAMMKACGEDGPASVSAKFMELQSQNADMSVQLANAESKCRELAAENSALKATCDDRRTFIMNGVQLGYIKVPTVDTDPALETIRIAVSPQEPTPVTDTFLAEVRAQGVDYAIGVIEDCANNLSPGGTGEAVQYAQEMVNPYLDSIHDKLADKSAQLRKGGAA